MNLVTFFFIYRENICCSEGSVNVDEIYLLENDYWGEDRKQIKTDYGYLSCVSISFKGGTTEFYGENCYQYPCFYKRNVKMYYLVLPDSMNKYINVIGNDKFYMMFKYTFTEDIKEYNGEVRFFQNYKYLNISTSDKIELISDGVDLRMLSIKNILRNFIIICKLITFNNQALSLYEKNLEESVGLELFQFETRFLCFKSLKSFVDSLNYLTLVDESKVKATKEDEKNTVNDFNTITTSFFSENLYKWFNKDFNQFDKKNKERFELNNTFFNECFIYLKNGLMSHEIFLPIVGSYNPNTYLKKLYILIREAIEDLKESTSSDTLHDLIKFSSNVEKLQESIVLEICKSEYVHKYFADVIGKRVNNINDYIKIEKILCDYYNVFIIITNLYNTSKPLHKNFYLRPSFVEYYKCQIVRGVRIHFNCMTKFGRIGGYSFDGKEITLEKDIDYSINDCGDVFILLETIRKISLYEIVVMNDDYTSRERFKIMEYLNK